MHKQRGAIEIVLVLLLVAALGLAGYFYLQSRNTQVKSGAKWFVEDEENLKNNIVNTPSPDSTAGWQAYTDSKFGISFKLPLDWVRNVSGEFSEVVYVLPSELSLNIAGYQGPLETASKRLEESESYVRKSPRIVDGHDALYVESKGVEIGQKNINVLVDDVKVGPTKKSEVLDIWFVVYDESGLSDYNSQIDQILSTFKFLQ